MPHINYLTQKKEFLNFSRNRMMIIHEKPCFPLLPTGASTFTGQKQRLPSTPKDQSWMRLFTFSPQCSCRCATTFHRSITIWMRLTFNSQISEAVSARRWRNERSIAISLSDWTTMLMLAKKLMISAKIRERGRNEQSILNWVVEREGLKGCIKADVMTREVSVRARLLNQAEIYEASSGSVQRSEWFKSGNICPRVKYVTTKC